MKRTTLRYGLWRFITMTTLFGAALGMILRANARDDQREALDRLQRKGASIVRCDAIGFPFYVIYCNSSRWRGTSADLTCLQAIRDAGEVYLPSDASIGDIRSLSGLEHLTKVAVHSSDIDDRAMETFVQLPALTSLNLSGTRITDRGIALLATKRKLWSLHLGRTEVTDKSVKALSQLKNLRYLVIAGTRISSEGRCALERALLGTDVM